MTGTDAATRTWDLPNVLTLVRVPLAVLVWVQPAAPMWVLAMMAAASLSDVLDGTAARWMRRRAARGGIGRSARAERVGSWLDPACDKLFVLSAVLVATFTYPHPWPVPLLLLVREAVMVPVVIAHRLSRHRARRVDYTAEAVGKVTTILQLLTLVLWIFGHAATIWLAIASAALGLVTAVVYVRRGHREVLGDQSTDSPNESEPPSRGRSTSSGRSAKPATDPKTT
ncbi:MAG: CDP-alcohol phosphatidyltransferase family protein [Deltaproteobacteria bacterium]|nr:CDP-alcohol phosphatidyltransferase family protein [Deltaproteobacteria bacterium]